MIKVNSLEKYEQLVRRGLGKCGGACAVFKTDIGFVVMPVHAIPELIGVYTEGVESEWLAQDALALGLK